MDNNRDESFMRQAIELSWNARLLSPPNPWVGCLLVKDNHIIGRGHTSKYGSNHAEVNALLDAGGQTQDAAAYVTLEPCSHWGKTPPCTEALIQAGIAKVVIGILDPDPRVSGQGIAKLQSAGIDVIVGVLENEVKQCLAPYLYHRTNKLPYVILKAALSLDGKIAAQDGSSKWISSEAARNDVQKLRAESQAILIGAGTALADSPRLTVRAGDLALKPLRVLIDLSGRVPAAGPLFDATLAPTLVVTLNSVSEAKKSEWQQSGVEVLVLNAADKREVIKQLLMELAKRGIIQVLVEGGAAIYQYFFEAGFFNEIILYYGNCIIGHEGKELLSSFQAENMSNAPRFRLQSVESFGDTVKVVYQ